MESVTVKPFRVCQAMRLIDGIVKTFADTGDEELTPAFALAVACIVERTMEGCGEKEWADHRAMARELLGHVDRIEMELAKADATQPEARA